MGKIRNVPQRIPFDIDRSDEWSKEQRKRDRERYGRRKGVWKVHRASKMGKLIPKASRASKKAKPPLECTLRFETKPLRTSWNIRALV